MYESDASELLMKEMKEYLDEYEIHLLKTYTRSTVNKHSHIIGFFINELNYKYGVTGFDQITLGMCGSKFVSTFNSHCGESFQLKSAKNTLRKFFSFIYETNGIANHELLDKLGK